MWGIQEEGGREEGGRGETSSCALVPELLPVQPTELE